jgi:uncharacterized membrane protein
MVRGSFGDIDGIINHHRLNVHFIIYIYEKYSYHLNLETKTTMKLTLMLDVELELISYQRLFSRIIPSRTKMK